MDHDLRTISYIADVGNILVLMVRRPHPSVPPKSAAAVSNNTDNSPAPSTSTATPSDESPDADRPLPPAKIICHLFESDEVSHSFGLSLIGKLKPHSVPKTCPQTFAVGYLLDLISQNRSIFESMSLEHLFYISY